MQLPTRLALALYQVDAVAAHTPEAADADGSETLLSQQLCAVYDAASSAAAAGGRAASEDTKAAEAAQAAVVGAHAAAQRASDTAETAQRAAAGASAAARCADEAAKALLRTAQGRTWKAVLDGGAPLWCAVLGTVFLTVFLWAARKKLDDLTATTSQGALCSLAAEHPEAVCLNARKEWSGSRAERVYLACGQQGEGCNHHIILKQALCFECMHCFWALANSKQVMNSMAWLRAGTTSWMRTAGTSLTCFLACHTSTRLLTSGPSSRPWTNAMQ